MHSVPKKAIRTAKGRLRADNVQSYERTYSQEEISATLLNISLLNLGVEDEALRSTAYDLACAVANSLQYEDSKTIPINGTHSSKFEAHLLTADQADLFPQTLCRLLPTLVTN
jgi:hypothetical protein